MIPRTPRTIPWEQQRRAREMRTNMTREERILWSRLRASGLGVKFSRQITIGPFIADFVCRTRKLVIELDGRQHGGPEDIARQRFIEAQGYRVVRFSNWQVTGDIDSVLRLIIAELGGGDDVPPPAPPACGRGDI